MPVIYSPGEIPSRSSFAINQSTSRTLQAYRVTDQFSCVCDHMNLISGILLQLLFFGQTKCMHYGHEISHALFLTLDVCLFNHIISEIRLKSIWLCVEIFNNNLCLSLWLCFEKFVVISLIK